MSTTIYDLRIRARSGWQPVDVGDVWRYRELLGFLAWRDIKVRYKQTLLGGLWAVLQPLVAMLVFGVVFSRVTNFAVQGPPYTLFIFAGLVPWTFFANSLSIAGNSLVGSEQMIRKIYFPRILVPLAGIAALTLDMVISLGFLAVLMLFFKVRVTVAILTLPVFLVGAILAASGLSLFLAALNVQYRDVKYVVPFFTQMALFVTPVLYPFSRIPERFRPVFALNPMAGIVEGFRFAVLDTPVEWSLVGISATVCAVLVVAGLFFFKRVERHFADII